MKIALIGTAPSSIRLAPYGDPDYQIWACSPGTYPVIPRCDKFFEIHLWEPGIVGKPETQKPWYTPEYVAWLGQQKSVVMVEPVLHNAEVLDVQGLTAKYGNYFFTSSLSWMMAMAINAIQADRKTRDVVHPHDDAIGLWGVDMAACTSGDARVLTADLRWVRADEVNVGDKLMAFDEETQESENGIPQRRWRVAEVLEASRLTKPCYRLTLEDGRELICSDDHQWLTNSEHHSRWRMAKDMVTPHHREDRPSKIIKLTDVWAEDKSWEAGYLAAAFDGEGHLSQKLRDGDNGVLRAGFAQRDNVMAKLVVDAMRKRGFNLTIDSGGKEDGDCRKYTVKGGRIENMRFLGSIRPRRLLDKFKPEDLGMMHKVGKIAVVKSEFIGDYPVIGLRTSTKTFICEGLASHNTEEYGFQRAGCQFFIQIANQLGIDIVVPPQSDLLCPSALYGVCEHEHHHAKMLARKAELDQRLANVKSGLEQLKIEEGFLRGALDSTNNHINTWSGNNPGRSALLYDIFNPKPEIPVVQPENISQEPPKE